MWNVAGRFEEIEYVRSLERFAHFYIVNFTLPMVAVAKLIVATKWMSSAGSRMISGTRLLLCVHWIMDITSQWCCSNASAIWLDRFQAQCLAACMSSVLQSLVMDYSKTAIFKQVWSSLSLLIDTTLRTVNYVFPRSRSSYPTAANY